MVLGAAPIKNAKILRLQTALNALGRLKDDRQLQVTADGVLGPKTVAATNRAVAVYVVQGAGPGRIPQAWQRMSSSMLDANALAIAREIENAAGFIPAMVSHDPPPARTAPMVPSPGGAPAMNPQYPQNYYPPQPAYYPQAPRAGGLPTNQASLDIKAFIPAQYEHIRLTPAGGLVIVLVGVMAAMLISQHRKSAK